jgi:hypothetical protein
MAYLKMATVQEKAMAYSYLEVFRNKFCYQNVTSFTELNMEKIHLQIILSDGSESSFKRLVVFSTEKDWEDRALRRKMLIESRKHFLEAHKNKLDELLCS